MSDLTVILAHHGTADGVLDVLQDLSAAGLIEPFLWVIDQDVTRSTVAATVVRAGRRERTTVQATVATRNFQRVRLGVLVPLVGDAESPSSATHQDLSELLNSSSGGAAVARVRLLIARPGGPRVTSASIEGWHNVLVAPEDSRGPGSGHVLLTPSDDAVEIGRHAAPAIASALGMWADVDHAPLDGTAPPPGQVIRVIRSFYRRFDTTRAESRLRLQVFAADGGLPLPRQRGASVSYVDDSALAARNMAQALWTKHRSVLRGTRVTPPKVSTKPIGILEAIKMFFGFIAAAIRNAPSEWYAGLVHRASSSVANAVHSTVYGSAPSAYAVVFNGVTADGRQVGLSDIGAASEALVDVLSDQGERREHEARTDLSALWDDFANGAMTLADAGERAQGLEPIQIGANRGVLRSVSDCVPSERDRFVVPGSVAAVIGIEWVSPSDVHGITGLTHRLRVAESDPLVGVEARTALTELRDWSTVHGRSYGCQVGGIMIDAVGRTVREVRELLARIKARADAADLSAEANARQRKLALMMKIFTGVLFVALIALGVMIGIGRLSALWGAIFGTGALIVWLIVSVVTFMRGQRDLFREMAKRQADAAQADADRLNLRTALRDLNRLANAYGQYLSWSKAVGAMLREPFGPAAAEWPDRPLIGHGLPLSVKVGSARPSPDVVANAGLQVRRELFGVGWLTPVWGQLIGNAGLGLGALGEDVRDNSRRLFADEGEGSGSPLDVWSERLARGEVTSAGSEALWEKAMSSLIAAESTVGRSLSETVETVTDGDRQAVRIEEFMAGSDSEEFGVQYFDDELFTDTASAAGDTRVATNIRSSVRNGLGAVAILTQLSDAIPEFQFRFCERDAYAPSTHRHEPDQGATPLPPADERDGFARAPEPYVGNRTQTDTPDITNPLTGPPGSGTYVF